METMQIKSILELIFIIYSYAIIKINGIYYVSPIDDVNQEFQCYPRDLCSQRHFIKNSVNQWGPLSEYYDSNCFCDMNCVIYDDCCRDRTLNNQPSNQSFYTCKAPFGQTYQVYLINKCPPDCDAESKNNCETDKDLKLDPLLNLPVFSPSNLVTYKNIFCAACNDVYNVIFWWPILKCLVTASQSTPDLLYNIIQHIKYNNVTGLWDPKPGDTTVTGSCTMSFDQPNEILFTVRYCKPNIIKTCDPKWTDESVRQKCLSYTAYVYQYNNNMLEKTFKNIHCAKCNYIAMDSLKCIHNQSVPTAQIVPPSISVPYPPLPAPPGPPVINPPQASVPYPPLPAPPAPATPPPPVIIPTTPPPVPSGINLSAVIHLDGDYMNGGYNFGTNTRCASGFVYDIFGQECRKIGCGNFQTSSTGGCFPFIPKYTFKRNYKINYPKFLWD